jgi:hypothetical protein
VSWTLNLMVRDRDTPISEVAFDADLLEDPDDVATVHALVPQALLRGCRTTGDLLDLVGNASVAEQRLIYDDAREAAGLERSEDIDAHAEFERANRAARRRAADRPVPACAVCGAHPTGAAACLLKFLPRAGGIAPTMSISPSPATWTAPAAVQLRDYGPHRPRRGRARPARGRTAQARARAPPA